MKHRATVIFILTHLYPAFIVGHLYFGDWCRMCQVMFNCCSLAVFGGLFLVWKNYSETPLNPSEQFSLSYLVFMLTVLYCYYIICINSRPEWVYDKNYQMGAFIVVTTGYYLLFYRNIKNAPK